MGGINEILGADIILLNLLKRHLIFFLIGCCGGFADLAWMITREDKKPLFIWSFKYFCSKMFLSGSVGFCIGILSNSNLNIKVVFVFLSGSASSLIMGLFHKIIVVKIKQFFKLQEEKEDKNE